MIWVDGHLVAALTSRAEVAEWIEASTWDGVDRFAALATTIETGLKRAIKDGSFDQLFNQEFGDDIQRSRMGSRRKLELTNPLLPAKTPLGQKELWLQF